MSRAVRYHVVGGSASMIGLFCVAMANLALVFQVAGGTPADSANPAPVAPAKLVVVDEAGAGHEFTLAEFSKLPQKTVKVTSHDKEAEFSGASLVDLLGSCDVEFGEKLKGKRASTVAVLDATDGYRIVVSLLEIDPASTDKVALVADERDGKPLDSKEGPYRLVLPGEKREIRWICNLKTIHVVNLKDLPLDGLTNNEGDHAPK
jgi:hypothetical protein